MKKLLPFLLLLLAPALHAQCAGVTTCSVAAPYGPTQWQAALNSINMDGTTLNVPASSTTWTSGITYTQTNSMVINCAGAESSGYPSATPIGTDQTTILDNINRSSSDTAEMAITLLAGKSFRMTGCHIAMSPSNTTQSFAGFLRFGGTSTSFRLDHNHLDQLNLVFVTFGGWIEGVEDHNQIDEFYSDTNGFRFGEPAWNGETGSGGPVGNNSWADTDHFGTSQFIFAENNTFNWLGATSNPSADFGTVNDCNDAGRAVFRYNLIVGLIYFQTHEMEGDFRGCRAVEVYNNTATASTNPNTTNFAFFVQTRMGTGLIYNNTLVGYKQVANFAQDRTNESAGEPHAQSQNPAGWGYCGTTTATAEGQTTSPWDNGSANPICWPSIDQVGRGQSQLLSGYFTPFGSGKINNVTGVASWPNNVQDPYYVFANSFTAPTGANGYATSNSAFTIQENRDYFLELPNFSEPSTTFNGTAGVGHGTLAPTNSGAYSGAPTCTNFTAYWQSSANTLWQCQSGTWASYYTPYTYPHPLTGGSQSTVTISPGTATCPNSNLGVSVLCQVFTLSNGSTGSATGLSFSFTGTNPTEFTLINNTCGTSIPGSGSCTVTAYFVPLNTGVRTAQLTYTVTLPVTGTGSGAATLTGTGLATPPAPATMFSMSGTLTMANFCKAVANQTQLCCGTDGCGVSKNGAVFQKFLTSVTLSPGALPSIAVQ
jgi:hypothetical protein